jgi:hypothetical protein
MIEKEKLIEALNNSYTALSVFENDSNTKEIEFERQKIRDALQAIRKSDENETK